ncbi:hypothetical protein F5Y15DRAFT_85332 [Xylariaceae sp. FL0016]|nr:hypothetical protein F5Y15DRAFT_85332 [Xylariaceae sp. FL0016]
MVAFAFKPLQSLALAIFASGIAIGAPATTSPESDLDKRGSFCQPSTFFSVPVLAQVADCQSFLDSVVERLDWSHEGGVLRLYQVGTCSLWINSATPVSFGGVDLKYILKTTIDQWTSNGMTGKHLIRFNWVVSVIGTLPSWKDMRTARSSLVETVHYGAWVELMLTYVRLKGATGNMACGGGTLSWTISG